MVRLLRSLRFRLILLVLVALLPTVGVIIYEGLEDRREATAGAQDQLRRLAAMVVREQAQKTMAARQILIGLAQAPAVRRQDAEVCSALFARMISKPSLFINIGAIHPDGNIFASGVPMTKPLNTKHLRYFQKALETRDFAVGNLQYGRIVLEPVLIFSHPVLDAAGEVQTVLYASVGLDWLNHLAAQARLPAGSVLTIIDGHGTIMAQYPDPEKWAGKSLPPGGLIELIRKHGQGVAEAQGMDGLPWLFAFMPLERDPQLGFVFPGIPTRVVYAAANQALRRNLAVLGVVLLLALGLAWGFGYLFLMRHIDPLVRATARLAGGDLSARAGLTGGPEELVQLAQAFDRMAGSLEERETERQRSEMALRESEELYRSLFDNMLNGLAYCKMLFEQDQPQDFIYLNVNRAFEDLTGLKNVVGKKVSEVIPGVRESNPELLQIYARVASTGQPERFETYVEPLQMWFYISVYSPEQEYFVAVFEVITVRKQAEAALRATNETLEAIIQASPAALIALDLQGLVTHWSPGAEKMFGWQAEEVLGRLSPLIPEDMLPEFRGLREQVLKGKGFSNLELLRRKKDGTHISIRLSTAPLRDLDGNITGIMSVCLDITARKQAEEELHKLTEELEDRVAERTAQLEATNTELDRFAYSVSHDLRAPLRSMQGFSQALLEDYAGELDLDGQDYARRINAAAERMDRLIQDLLAYSRLSREEMTLQPVSLEQAVAEALAHLEGDVRTRGAHILVESPLPEVRAHRATLVQVVANLVSNAIKFTAPDLQPQVRLRAEDRGERVRLWVEDNGLGITPEHQERIFRIFERLHGVEAYAGTGIGLAIVKKGVERMGGQVGVESDPGQGSRFWVELAKSV